MSRPGWRRPIPSETCEPCDRHEHNDREDNRGDQEYLLERRMLRRLSSGELIDTAFTLFSFPTGWHYDALRGLDYLREAGVTPDARVAEATDLVRSKRDAEGRWPLENPHESELVDARVRDLELDMDEREGRPSRWNTLRGLRVLRWASRS